MHFTVPAGAGLGFTDSTGAPLDTQWVARTRVIMTPDDTPFAH